MNQSTILTTVAYHKKSVVLTRDDMARSDGSHTSWTPVLYDAMIENPYRRAVITGLAVGITDVICVFPLAVLATRRECGDSLRAAIGRGKLWSGGMTAGTLLVPYSVCVESVSTHLDGVSSGQGVGLVAVLGTTAVTTLGVQPIEKKLVMDQMLQTAGHEKLM